MSYIYPFGREYTGKYDFGAVQGGIMSFGGPWYAPTWSYNPATGIWTNTPTLGAELVTDGDMEAAGVAAWSLTGTATISKNAVTPISGLQDLNIVCLADFDGCSQSITGPRYQWYKCSFIGRKNSGAGFGRVQTGAVGGQQMFNSALDITALTNNSASFIFVPMTGALNILAVSGRTAAVNFNVDNLSVKQLSGPTLFAARNFGQQVPFAVNATFAAGYCAGVVARLDNPANPLNYVLCWHDRINLHLDMVINGVVTSLVNAAAAYVAGAKIAIVWNDANTAQAKYNEVNIGAPQDVTTVPVGYWAGMFSPDASVQLTNPDWS